MIETGKVIKLKGEKAVIRVDRKSGCEMCHMCAIKPKSPHIDITLKNGLNAKKGDTVEVEMADRVVIKSSFLVYTIPLITGFIGLLIGTVFSNMLYQLIMFAGFLILGFTILIFIDKLVKNNKKFVQKITRIVLETTEIVTKDLPKEEVQDDRPEDN